MNRVQLEKILLIEIHHQIRNATHAAVAKLGFSVPPEARVGYLSEDELNTLRSIDPLDFSNPLVQKSLLAIAARDRTLSYPPDGQITETDAIALESFQLTEAQRSVLERVVAEACHTAFFHFLCLLDSVADPELTSVKQWRGASLSYPRKEGAMLHDELGDAYYVFRKSIEG